MSHKQSTIQVVYLCVCGSNVSISVLVYLCLQLFFYHKKNHIKKSTEYASKNTLLFSELLLKEEKIT